MATLNFEAKRALSRLEKEDIVENVKVRYRRVAVSFSSGITEYWYLRPNNIKKRFRVPFPKSHYYSGKELIPQLEYEESPFCEDKYSHFFIITKKQQKKFGFCEVRLALHHLIMQLRSEGWIDLEHPKHVLLSDLWALQNSDTSKYQLHINRVKLYAYDGYQYPGVSVIEHCLPIAYHEPPNGRAIVQAWKDPIALWKALNYLTTKNWDITRSSITQCLLSRHRFPNPNRIGPFVIRPGYYINLINNIKRYTKVDSIADLAPKWGGKALAAQYFSIPYGYRPDDIFTSKVGDKLNSILQPDVHKMRKRDYDLIFLNDEKPLNYEDALKLLKYKALAKAALLLVHRDSFDAIMKEDKADRVIEMEPNVVYDGHNYHYALLYLQT